VDEDGVAVVEGAVRDRATIHIYTSIKIWITKPNKVCVAVGDPITGRDKHMIIARVIIQVPIREPTIAVPVRALVHKTSQKQPPKPNNLFARRIVLRWLCPTSRPYPVYGNKLPGRNHFPWIERDCHVAVSPHLLSWSDVD
jgi:hypothetical protein